MRAILKWLSFRGSTGLDSSLRADDPVASGLTTQESVGFRITTGVEEEAGHFVVVVCVCFLAN